MTNQERWSKNQVAQKSMKKFKLLMTWQMKWKKILQSKKNTKVASTDVLQKLSTKRKRLLNNKDF